MAARTARIRRQSRMGGVMVEMALVAPILAFLLFGALELGLQHRTGVQVDSIAREAARLAASGETPAVVHAIAADMATDAGVDPVRMTLQYTYFYIDGWTAWTALGTNGSENSAPGGAVIRARIEHDYHYFMPGLMNLITGSSGETHLIRRAVSMMRE